MEERQRVEAVVIREPALVDGPVVAAPHPQDLTIPGVQLNVAAQGATGADARGALEIPGAGLETVPAAGERADRTELDRVAAERRVEGVAFDDADLALAASI